LEINQPHDLLKSVLNTITEYEQSKEEGDGNKSKMVSHSSVSNLLSIHLSTAPQVQTKDRTEGRIHNRRVSRSFHRLLRRLLSLFAFHGACQSSLSTRVSMLRQPFPLDYHQTLLSFLDVLSEVYNKISKLLGPSPFPLNSQLMMGPLAGVVPQPGVAYLFSGQSGFTSNGWTTPQHQSHTHLPSIFGVLNEGQSLGSLWDIANGPPVGSAGMMFHNAGLGGPPVNWTSVLGEMVLKIDGKFKVCLSFVADLCTDGL